MNMKKLEDEVIIDEKNIDKEFLLLYYEISNRYNAYKSDYKSADAAMYLMNMSKSLGFNLENEIIDNYQKVLKK